MKHVNGVEYDYDESLVRRIPEGVASLTALERHVLDLADDGIYIDKLGGTIMKHKHVKQPTKGPQLPQDESFCKICGRVPFGKVVPLGFDTWRHNTCELGSEEWRLYYLALDKSIRSKLAEFHKFTYQEV